MYAWLCFLAYFLSPMGHLFVCLLSFDSRPLFPQFFYSHSLPYHVLSPYPWNYPWMLKKQQWQNLALPLLSWPNTPSLSQASSFGLHMLPLATLALTQPFFLHKEKNIYSNNHHVVLFDHVAMVFPKANVQLALVPHHIELHQIGR